MIRALDVTDPETAKHLLAIQHAAYAVEAELIGFNGIPPLHEDLAGLMSSTEHWLGRYAPAGGVRAGGARAVDPRAGDAPAAEARAGDARAGDARASGARVVDEPAVDAPAAYAPVGDAIAGDMTGEVLVGAVAYEFPDGGTLEISRLVVDPAHARRGHARALLDHLDALEPRPSTLVSTGSANAPAVSLYLSRGFAETGRTTVAPGVQVTHFARGGSADLQPIK